MEKKIRFSLPGAVIYLICILVVGFLWWYFRGYELFIMLLGLFAVGAASLLVLYRAAGSFSAYAQLPATGIGKDRQVPVTIGIRSRSIFPGMTAETEYELRNVFTEYCRKDRKKIGLKNGLNDVLRENISSRHAGRVEVAIKKVKVWDWLHIACLENVPARDAAVLVAPMPEGTDLDLALAVEDFPDEREFKKRGTDVNPDYEVREYIPGDDLRSIHWKLSAKQGRTMVRERLSSGKDRINVLLPLTMDDQENDLLVAALQQLCAALIDKGYPVSLCRLGTGDELIERLVAEEGELVNIVDEILSSSGKKDPVKARSVMETEHPREAYILVQSGAYKGAYIR